MGVRCDVAQEATYFPRHGRVGAPGHCCGVCSALWHREGSCAEHPVLPCPAALGSALVTAARH